MRGWWPQTKRGPWRKRGEGIKLRDVKVVKLRDLVNVELRAGRKDRAEARGPGHHIPNPYHSKNHILTGKTWRGWKADVVPKQKSSSPGCCLQPRTGLCLHVQKNRISHNHICDKASATSNINEDK